MSRVITFVLLLSFYLAGACSFRKTRILTLCTNISPFTAYIEYFNASQDRSKIQIIYTENAGDCLKIEHSPPDLIIFDNLADPALLPDFESLSKLMKPEIIPPDSIYAPLLATGLYKNTQVLLPLNFSLPMVLFNHEHADKDIVSLIIFLDTLRTKALEYYPGDPKKFGFFPFWNTEFLYASSSAMGAAFHVDQENHLYWNKPALNQTIDFFINWMNDIQGGYEAGKLFTDKYMNIPAYKLLEQDQILYYFSSSEELFSIPREKQKNIDFRWFAYNHQIPVNDNITYIGIPRKAVQKKAAMEFIKWFFTLEIQSRLLEVNKYKRISGIFGIANKFSSIIQVNEQYLPQHNPLLVGHIPEPDYLLFPGMLLENWSILKDEIIINWIVESVILKKIKGELENSLNF